MSQFLSQRLPLPMVPSKKTKTFSSTPMDAVTPFRRIPLDPNEPCGKVPDIPFTSYDLFCFRSKLQLDQPYTLINKIINGEVVNTVQLLTSSGDLKKLNTNEIQSIQSDINQINQQFPNYFYFCSSLSFPYFQPWVKTILSNLEFYRTLPPPYENTEVFVPQIIKEDKIYLNLVDAEISYQDDAKLLFKKLNDYLDELYHMDDLLPEQLYEKQSGLPITLIPEVNDLSLPPNPMDSYNKYVLDLNFDPGFDFLTSLIGSKFIQSFKQFLNAFDVTTIIKENLYEFIPLDENLQSISSKINIKEMYGKIYVTSSPYGLLALSKLFDPNSITPVLDEFSGKIGLFVPMIENGSLVELTMWQKLNDNFELTYDVYFLPSETLKNKVKRLGLIYEEVELQLDEIHSFSYLFVEKHPIYTQIAFLRSMDEPHDLIVMKIIDEEPIQKGFNGTGLYIV